MQQRATRDKVGESTALRSSRFVTHRRHGCRRDSNLDKQLSSYGQQEYVLVAADNEKHSQQLRYVVAVTSRLRVALRPQSHRHCHQPMGTVPCIGTDVIPLKVYITLLTSFTDMT